MLSHLDGRSALRTHRAASAAPPRTQKRPVAIEALTCPRNRGRLTPSHLRTLAPGPRCYDQRMIRPFLVGFATTFRHMFRKPNTVNYPAEKLPMYPKYRGKQVLMRDENGLEKCVACGLCAVACPADAIYLEAAENDGTVMAGPRYASVYQIHKTRCIFCGYCEEACPVSAIFMGKDYELAVYSKDDFVWDKQDLLVPASIAPAALAPQGR